MMSHDTTSHDPCSGPNVGSTVTQKLTLFDDRWSRGRVVTSMDWSDQHPELVLASYNRATEESSTDPNGLVLLWNTKLQKTTPEYILQAQVCSWRGDSLCRGIPYHVGDSPSNMGTCYQCTVGVSWSRMGRSPSVFELSLAV